ncbi:MAG: hypothetical protein AAB884_02230 [Patescibacteria group bacterium]
MAKPQDSESLVAECLSSHAKETRFVQVRTLPNTLASLIDSSGIDFVIAYNPLSLHADWQIKTSANGTTKAIVMPLRETLPEKLLEGLSDKMRRKVLRDIIRHERRHPRCFLFVSRISKAKTKEEILGEIWKELVRAYETIKSRQR